MANPRQRQKARSSSHKAVRLSRRAKKIQKKQPPIRGPKALQEAWDANKTVRQNFESIGLAHSLGGHDSGGNEQSHVRPKEEAAATAATEGEQGRVSSKGIPRGYGRIIRDEAGKVVDVEYNSEDEAEEAEEKALDESERIVQQARRAHGAADWLLPVAAAETNASEVVQNLEKAAAAGPTTGRGLSAGETALLRALVAAHGDDVEAMAGDAKLNPSQHTAGQLRRALRRLDPVGSDASHF